MRPQGQALAAEQAAVCEELRRRTEATALATPDGIALLGTGFQTRIGELREMGWDVRDRRVGRHRAYWIVGDAPVLDPDPCEAGCTIRRGPRKGWTSRTHGDARRHGVVPAEVLEEAEAAALAAYREVVERHEREARVARGLYRDERGLLHDPVLELFGW
jgi:hypothetical protein